MNTNKNITQHTNALEFLDDQLGPLTLQKCIESIRLGEKWSKKKMAATIGISPSYYSDFVDGKKRISAKKAYEWGEILGYGGQCLMTLALEDQLKRQGLSFKIIAKAS